MPPDPTYRHFPTPRPSSPLSRLRYRFWTWVEAGESAEARPINRRARLLLVALVLPVCAGCGALAWAVWK